MSWSRALFGLALGSGLAWGVGRAARFPRDRAEAPVAVWVADRGGDRVVALDADLFVLRLLEVRAPCAVEPGPRGGAWIGTREGPARSRLIGIEGDGSVHTELGIGPLRDLASVGKGAVLVLEGEPREVRAWLVEADRPPLLLAAAPGLEHACGAFGMGLLGSRDGELFAVGPDGRWLGIGAVPGRVVDTTAGPRPFTWWVLHRPAGGASSLALVDAHLSVLRSSTVPAAASVVIPSGGGSVWILEEHAPRLHRSTAGGRVELVRGDLPLGDVQAGHARPGGGLLVAVPGALLAFDRDGASVPGQGGFDFLNDLAVASP